MRLQVERQTASPSARASDGGALERQRDALAQLDRRDVVRDADERERQKWLPARTRRATITKREPDERELRGAPARSARATTKPA